MNLFAIKAIFKFEMRRFFKTYIQSLLAPTISTSLYFIVFGAAIGSKVSNISGVSYAAFIVPGLTMLTVMNQSVSNASFGFFMPRFVGTIYEILSAPVSTLEIVLGYVGSAVVKSIIISIVILATARGFVNYPVSHPGWMLFFLLITAIDFSLLGFIIAIWAESFERLHFFPLLVITPLTFLGGTFYSVQELPGFWRNLSYFNPVFYVIAGFRSSFFDLAEVPLLPCALVLLLFMCAEFLAISIIFRTGYRVRT